MANISRDIFDREFRLMQMGLVGVKIVVVPTFQYTVKRAWKERLFSLPWRPFLTHRTEQRELLRDGEFVQYNDQYVIYCNSATKKRLEQALNV